MKYQVVWRATARQHLATIWKSDTDRNAIAEAVAALEDVLEIKPTGVGEVLSETRHLLVKGPLAAIFLIDEARQRVSILSVRLLPGH
jgi:hypothetical protein